MRTTLLLLASATLVAAPLGAAHAAGSYSVSAGVSDDKLDLTSADGSNRSTHIKGRVTGGPVSGKRIYFYASNESSTDKKYVYIGSDALSSSGRFDKVWKPVEGGSYKIKAVKKAGSGKKEGFDYTRVQVFNYTNLARFYDDDNPRVTRVDKAGKVGDDYWSTAYQILGDTTAVFDTAGYKCFRINFKIGVANDSAGGTHAFRVYQGDTTIMSGQMEKGQKFREPSKEQQARMNATQVVRVQIQADGNSDQTKFILGNPKAACTYPLTNDPEGQ